MPPRAQLAVESRQLGCLPSTVVSEWPFPSVLQKGLALLLSFFCTPIAAHWSSDDKRTGLSLASVPSSFSDACWTNGDESSVHCERDDLPCRCGRPVQYFFFFNPKVWCDSNNDHLKKWMSVFFLFLFVFFYGGNWLLYNVCERVCVWLQSMHASPTGNMKTCCKTARKFTVALL